MEFDEQRATPAAEFRKVREQGELVTLPTGRKVRMRVVKPAALLRLGDIPDILAELAMRVLYGPLTFEAYEKFYAVAERREQAVAMADSFRLVCTAALVEPVIVDDPQRDGEIHIDDLEDVEQRAIFDLALTEATRLSRFREEQAEHVDPVDEQQADPHAAEPVG